MTYKVFWEDSYRTSLTTTVVAVSGVDVTLAETIFFAFSGGQESDRGSIGGHEVVEARWEGGDLVYSLVPDHGLAPGDAVAIEIDAERRSRLARLHMATEIVLELFTLEDANLVKVGAHIGVDRARIDFSCDELLTPRLGAIESAVNSMIADDLEIISAFSDEAAERRFWEIAGFARVPCSGTHPERTGEIGPVSLRRRNPGKGKERVEITFA
ncbi:MAG: alanyl-tRNA editing protein [bacterium]|nr:alanyl-tRNA editing protein [bacterium]